MRISLKISAKTTFDTVSSDVNDSGVKTKIFVGEPKDFGEVGTKVDNLAVFKGPSSGHAEYRNFLLGFNLPKSTP